MVHRILVIDDEVNICTLMERILTMEGYEVGQATNQQEALELFDREHWDLLLLDVYMPEISGWKLAAMLRDRKPEVRRCFMTARIDAAYDEAVTEGLIHSYMYKPFSFEDVRVLVRDTLDMGDTGA